jgi:hypothetical protein
MRTTQDVFDSHILYTLDWDIEEDLEQNYASDCYLLSSYGIFLRRDGIHKAYAVLETELPEADMLYSTKLVQGEMAFLEWQAESDDCFVDDGVETFLIRNEKIIGQTMHYTIRTRER